MSITVAPRKIEDIAHDFFLLAGGGEGGINIMGGGELKVLCNLIKLFFFVVVLFRLFQFTL